MQYNRDRTGSNSDSSSRGGDWTSVDRQHCGDGSRMRFEGGSFTLATSEALTAARVKCCCQAAAACGGGAWMLTNVQYRGAHLGPRSIGSPMRHATPFLSRRCARNQLSDGFHQRDVATLSNGQAQHHCYDGGAHLPTRRDVPTKPTRHIDASPPRSVHREILKTNAPKQSLNQTNT